MTLMYSEIAKKQLSKLDKPVQKMIKKRMAEVIALEDPRSKGKGLLENRSGYWRYRAGDYRIICEIHDEKFLIVALKIGHRKEVYK